MAGGRGRGSRLAQRDPLRLKRAKFRLRKRPLGKADPPRVVTSGRGCVRQVFQQDCAPETRRGVVQILLVYPWQGVLLGCPTCCGWSGCPGYTPPVKILCRDCYWYFYSQRIAKALYWCMRCVVIGAVLVVWFYVGTACDLYRSCTLRVVVMCCTCTYAY